MKTRKQKLAKKHQQGKRNYQRKLDHEHRLQAELGTDRFGYWQFPLYGISSQEIFGRSQWFGDWHQDKPPLGERVYHIEIVIKEKQINRTFVDGYRTEPCRFGDIYHVVVNHLDEIYKENPTLSPDSYKSFARIRT
ncbi:hypothetical protein ACFBZI_08380 [Moraxella sp. ZJ142]|uniref:hypothetical protein n=1 Tax=Moraxella marmotae TaxID=3344520 RepID=UPI0035D423F1